MADGQLAMNTNLASPGLFFKDSNGDLVKVGPVHVGTTAPNATPASGGQAGNSKGEQWLDTSGTNPVLKVWDGSNWASEAGEFVNASGDIMTGALVMDNQQQVRFREASGNGTNFIAIEAPASVTADRTLTLPDVTGTIVSTGDTGTVTSTMILDGTILNADVNASAAIVDTKLATIATAGKVSNSATTADSANTASAIVARDASGNFTAGTITAALTGAASSNVLKTGDTMTGALVVPLASAATPSLTFTGDLNTGVFSPGADQVAISTNGTGRLFVDASGNVSIATATSDAKFRVFGNTKIGEGVASPTGKLLVNTISGQAASIQLFQDGVESWIIQNPASSADLSFGNSGTERMRLDSSGRLGLGTTSPAQALDVNGNVQISGSTPRLLANMSGTQSSRFAIQNSTTNGNTRLYLYTNGTGNISAINGVNNSDPNASDYQGFDLAVVDTTDVRLSSQKVGSGTFLPITFYTSDNERARITSDGKLLVGTSIAVSSEQFNVTGSAGNYITRINNSNASPSGLLINYTGASPNGTSNEFLLCFDNASGGTTRASIRSNGGIANYSANNVNLSDRNAKKDISPAVGTWDCLKEWEIVNFRYKDQPDDADLNMGVIAQQVAENCPEVITVFQEATEDQPEKLGVKDQQMMWMAIKALQEAQLRIETLEAEVAALKGA
jgi:hypothetical protein